MERYVRFVPGNNRYGCGASQFSFVESALPIAVYYALIITYNPGFAEWNRQNINPAPAPAALLIGLGIPLLLGLPGFIRGITRFERDGDRLVVLWLLAILVVMYLQTGAGRRFAVGMMLPIAYFATPRGRRCVDHAD